MDKPIKTVLLLGGNMGDTNALLAQATQLIAQRIGNVWLKSSLYVSEAWGFETDQHFINQAVVAETVLPPHDALSKALAIESELGRIRSGGRGYSSRTMDIDIIFWGNQVIENPPELVVPHPRMHLRNFVLMPVCEIMPEFVHPLFGKTIAQLLAECPDTGKVWRLEGNPSGTNL